MTNQIKTSPILPQKVTPHDLKEAQKIFLGLSMLYKFEDNAISLLLTTGGEKPDRDHSQQYRGVEAATVDLLLQQDPQAEHFSVTPVESLTDDLKEWELLFSDGSEEHPQFTCEALEFGITIESEEENERCIDQYADMLRCFEKHPEANEMRSDLEEMYPAVFSFMKQNEARIAKKKCERETQFADIERREKFDQEVQELRQSDAFWQSLRLTIAVEKDLISKVRQSLTLS